MGRRGPLRKAAERRQREPDESPPPIIGVIRPKPRRAPAPLPEFLACTKEDWRRWWASRLARLADPDIDLPDVRRLFRLRDERERLAATSKKEPRKVPGSRRQPVQNPILRRLQAVDAEIRLLGTNIERRLLERAQLGYGDDADDDSSADALNRAFYRDAE